MEGTEYETFGTNSGNTCKCILDISVVPRSHPLTRRNSLVNQVELLGLVHTFATVSPSNIQNILRQPRSKNVQIAIATRVEISKLTVVRKVLRNNYRSRNLIGPYYFLGFKPKKFDSVHQTIFSPGSMRRVGTRLLRYI